MSQNFVTNPSFERVDTPVYWNSGTFINTSVFPAIRNVTDWDWYISWDNLTESNTGEKKALFDKLNEVENNLETLNHRPVYLRN
ncbi:MAG: hypothetical protein H7141_05490 [Burkholderiales bacterium]|nr:hypothetical protein [Bacteroidia bacterium]